MRRGLAAPGVVSVLLISSVGAAQTRDTPARAKPTPKPSTAPTPEPPPAPGWNLDSSGAAVRDSEERDPDPFIRSDPRGERSTLIVKCSGGKFALELRPAGMPAFDPRPAVLIRLDEDRASERKLLSTGHTMGIDEGDATVRSMLSHYWMALRYSGHNGYRDHTFNLSGLDNRLAAMETRCGLTAGTVAAAAALRPAKAPAAPANGEKTSTSERWSVTSRRSLFQDTRDLVLSVPSIAPIGRKRAPARLLLRALDKKVEAYVVVPGGVGYSTVGHTAVSFDGATAHDFKTVASTDRAALFLLPTKALLRGMAAHKKMAVLVRPSEGDSTQAEFLLDGFDQAAHQLLEAAGLPPSYIVEPQRSGKWQPLLVEEEHAVLKLPSDAPGDASVMVGCQFSRLQALVAATVTDKDAENVMVAYGPEKPNKTRLWPAASDDRALVPSARVFAFGTEKEVVKRILHSPRMTLRFGKKPQDTGFDLAGLDTWLEILADAGCTKALTEFGALPP